MRTICKGDEHKQINRKISKYFFITTTELVDLIISTGLFRQPNYWRSTSYVRCLAIHVNLTVPCGYIHSCLSAMHAAPAFYPQLAAGQPTAQTGRAFNKHSKALEQSTLTTRLRKYYKFGQIQENSV